MTHTVRKKEGYYTYRDLLEWPEGERWELIDGVAYDMTQAPTTRHQAILGELAIQLHTQLDSKPYRIYFAPLDVFLPDSDKVEEDFDTVVQPDILICHRSKLIERGCKGAPELVIEILLPETAEKDLQIKPELYQRVGVKEYWVVEMIVQFVMVFKLDTNGYYGKPAVYDRTEQIPVGVLDGLTVDLARVFAEEA